MVDQVVFTDVGPRDGLQNQPKILTVDERLTLIRAIAAAGVQNIEVGSFVSPKAVPAMAGTDELVAGLPGDDGVHYSALIPNRKGYELARDAGVRTVNMVLYASEGMAQKNVKMSIAEAEDATRQILAMAAEDGVEVVAAIATAFACPFDGPTDPGVVRDIVARFIDSGIEQLVLADTIGAANPKQVRSLTADLVAEHGADRLSFSRYPGDGRGECLCRAGIRYLSLRRFHLRARWLSLCAGRQRERRQRRCDYDVGSDGRGHGH